MKQRSKTTKKKNKLEEDDKAKLERYAKEIRNLPYLEDRVGQAFIMFTGGYKPKNNE